MKQKGGYQETDNCFFSSLNQFSGSDRSFLTTDKILQPFPGHFLFNLLLSVLEQELWCELLCNWLFVLLFSCGRRSGSVLLISLFSSIVNTIYWICTITFNHWLQFQLYQTKNMTLLNECPPEILTSTFMISIRKRRLVICVGPCNIWSSDPFSNFNFIFTSKLR